MPPPSEGEPASQESPLEHQPPFTSTIRVSTQERDETVQRLQTAFVEGRLNDQDSMNACARRSLPGPGRSWSGCSLISPLRTHLRLSRCGPRQSGAEIASSWQ